jgi:2,3-bisphosphoglycerate-dependent phosphoglycerate mutase
MTHLYLIRHADYLYDLVDGQYPRCDQGLTPTGIQQAERLRDRLASSGEIKPDVLIASTERGATETAQMIAPALNMLITPDPEVVEWRSEDGSLSDEEFMRQWDALTPEQKPYHRWVDGCETMLEFSIRVYKALQRILTEHEGKTILIVTHGAFIQTSFAHFFGYSMAVPQRAGADINRTSITHWYKPAGALSWRLERSNDCHHLDGM